VAQIRNVKIQDIKDKINESKLFSLNDFKFEFPDNGDIIAKIVFRGLNRYSFIIKETFVKNENDSNAFSVLNFRSQKIKRTWQTIAIPGKVKIEERVENDDIDICIHSISSWLYNLDEDLKNEFNFEDIEAFQNIDEFEKRLNKNFPDENEKFTHQEKEDLTQKLQELQERIEKLEQNNDTKKQIEIIEQSKIEIEQYPKKAWWLKFYNRFNSLNNGLNLLNNISDNITKLLDKFGG